MAIGERIRFFRNLRGLTQKYLGMMLGFPEATADARIGQYEIGNRTPRPDAAKALASALDVSVNALTVPDIDSVLGLAHTLFTLEDMYGLTVSGESRAVCLRLEGDNKNAADLASVLEAWRAEKAKLERGEISREDYDRWRYHYPEYETAPEWGRVPSDELNDDMRKRFSEMLKPD